MFKLRTEKPIVDDGVAYYSYERYSEEDDSVYPVLRVIDDKTLKEPTLAKRRLMLKALGVPLYKIKYAIFFLGDFIKISQPSMYFIDSEGKIFNYKKSIRAKLKIYKITKLFNIRGGGCIIEVEGLITRFKSLYPPDKGFLYAGILHYGKSSIFYGYYDQKHDDTWRLV